MTDLEMMGLLQAGAVLDGIAMADDGKWIARGKVKLEGTCWRAMRPGTAVSLVIKHPKGDVTGPFVQPVPVQEGEPLEIEFARRWHG